MVALGRGSVGDKVSSMNRALGLGLSTSREIEGHNTATDDYFLEHTQTLQQDQEGNLKYHTVLVRVIETGLN